MKKLKIGQSAPNIKTKDVQGNDFDLLEELKGFKVLISFYRDVYCPFCNLRIHQLCQNQGLLESNNIVLVSIFNSTAEELLVNSPHKENFINLIPDPDRLFYQKYGIESSIIGKVKSFARLKSIMSLMIKGYFSLRSMSRGNILPADFLIDEQGVLLKVHYGKDFGDHLSLNDLDII